MIRASLGVSPSPNGIAFFSKAFEVVVGQLHLGTVDAFALTTKLQQRRQVFVEHASLLNSGIAVVKDLRQEGLQPNTVAHVTLNTTSASKLSWVALMPQFFCLSCASLKDACAGLLTHIQQKIAAQ